MTREIRVGGGVVWLDGGIATELQRGGLRLGEPWWTTLALNSEARRRILREVHERYVAAGAQVITANTARCNLRTLQRIGLDGAGLAWMVHAAVGVATSARGTGTAQVAGSMAPVEDRYRPDLVPSDEELRHEHRWLATELMRSGVDLILIETMNSSREALIALEEVRAVGGRPWVSFVCDDEARLLSGERLCTAARLAEREGALAVLVNCTTLDSTEIALRELREAYSAAIGAYPNVEDRGDLPARTHTEDFVRPAVSPDEFADRVASWREEYAVDVLGGCCGTTPDHIAAAAARTAPAGRPSDGW